MSASTPTLAARRCDHQRPPSAVASSHSGRRHDHDEVPGRRQHEERQRQGDDEAHVSNRRSLRSALP